MIFETKAEEEFIFKITCMFCGQEKESSKEHIIPKAIGNGSLITDDVCKDCNSALGETIDDKFVNNGLIDLKRSTYDLKGYGGNAPTPITKGTDEEGNTVRFDKDLVAHYIPKITDKDGKAMIIAESESEGRKVIKKKLERKNVPKEEIDEILNLLEDKYRDKVPEKVRAFFKEEKMVDYKPTIDVNTPLIQQNLKRETIVLLAILNLNYWCDTSEEKQEILDELSMNEKEKQKLLEEYNSDNLFKKRPEEKQEFVHTEELSVVEYKKPNFIQKLLNKIARLFKK